MNSVSEIHDGSEYLASSEKVVDWPVPMSRTLTATALECDSNEYVDTGSPAQEGFCQYILSTTCSRDGPPAGKANTTRVRGAEHTCVESEGAGAVGRGGGLQHSGSVVPYNQACLREECSGASWAQNDKNTE